MKLSKSARVKKNLATAAEAKKVVAAARTLLSFNLISLKRAAKIATTYGYRGSTIR